MLIETETSPDHRVWTSSRQSRSRLHMEIASAERREHTEGQIAKTIESQTAKLPSDTETGPVPSLIRSWRDA